MKMFIPVLLTGFLVSANIEGADTRQTLPAHISNQKDVTIISEKLNGEIRGAIRSSGDTIFFETKSALMTEDEILENGNIQSVERFDARFFDEKGRTFSMIVSGDGPIDPSWSVDPPNAGQATPGERSRHFRLALQFTSTGVNDIRREQGSPTLNASLFSTPSWEILRRLSTSTTADGNAQSTAHQINPNGFFAAIAATYTHEIRAYWKPAAFTFGWGHHTATWTRQLTSSGGLYKQIITCNHGACADDSSSMSEYCRRSYAGRSTDIASLLSPYMMEDTYTGYCTTYYGPLSGQHVCNDDTLVQLTTIKNNARTQMTVCYDATLAKLGPTCP